jgi:hypothetical protein
MVGAPVAREGVEPGPRGAGLDPQWAEAYRLFDGEYASLEDLLRTLPDRS